ncbi:hypothetical protein [Amycolatopsis sp. NPDC051061]|uniref:hypothetical protein n=1 Tax=Amycolatopsis sp. NPDC051061 TaxID=3155042 RepID=UPI0034480347
MFAILITGCGRRFVEKGALGIVTVGGVERRIDLSNLDLDRAAVMVAARCAGWADVIIIHPGIDEPASEYVELGDVEEFGPVFDRVVGPLV